MMNLRHDNKLLNSSWFVERVEIEDLTADRHFIFYCERWLARSKEDKKIDRNFYEKDFKVCLVKEIYKQVSVHL